MRLPRVASLLLVTSVLAGCGTAAEVEVEPPTEQDAGPEEEASGDDEDPDQVVGGQHADGFEVRLDGATLEVIGADGETRHGWTLPDGATFHTFLVHPDSDADDIEVVALALEGERPVLQHVWVHGSDAGMEPFPDHLQPLHEVDAAPPVLGWTPDGRSLVWTEPTADGLTLLTVGWDEGPGTGESASDNAAFGLDAPADAHVDGFEVLDDGRWLLLLRDSSGGDPTEIPLERQADGALALPGAG